MDTHDPDSFIPRDPDDQVGVIFRRLSAYRTEFGPGHAFERATRAMLGALGRAAHEEAERRARDAREDAERTGIRVTPTRRVDFDGGFDFDDRG